MGTPIEKDKSKATNAQLALHLIRDSQSQRSLDAKHKELLTALQNDYNGVNPFARKRAEAFLDTLGARIRDNYNQWDDDPAPRNDFITHLKTPLDSIKKQRDSAEKEDTDFRNGLASIKKITEKGEDEKIEIAGKEYIITGAMIDEAKKIINEATKDQVRGDEHYDSSKGAAVSLRDVGQVTKQDARDREMIRLIKKTTAKTDQQEEKFHKTQTAVEYYIKELKKIENDETREQKVRDGAARVRMDLEKMDLHNIPENQKANIDNIVEIYDQKTSDPEENNEKVFRNLRDAVLKTAAKKKTLEEKLEESEKKDLAESTIKTLRRLYPANNRYNMAVRNHLKTLEDAVSRDDKDAIDALASFGKKTKGKSDTVIKRMWNQMMRNLMSIGSANRQTYAPYGNNRLFGGAVNNPYNQIAAMQNWGTGFGLPAGGVMAPYPLNPFLGGFQLPQFNWGQTLGLPNFPQLPGM